MSRHVVAEVEAAREAADWYLRLENGLTRAEYRSFDRWLRASPDNADAMTFLEQLCGSLQSRGDRVGMQ